MDGLRVIQLVGRNKDKAKPRSVLRVSPYGKGSFEKVLHELDLIRQPGERIYASACARDINKAIKKFKYKQLDAEFSGHPEVFYQKLNANWVSSLMQYECALERRWLLDIDEGDDYHKIVSSLPPESSVEYQYESKNGIHAFVKPFNRKEASLELLDCVEMNPYMLWSYDNG